MHLMVIKEAPFVRLITTVVVPKLFLRTLKQQSYNEFQLKHIAYIGMLPH